MYDTVRSTLPKSTLEEAYASKDAIAHAVLDALDTQMSEYGYKILQTLVTDMMPEMRVKNSFNEVSRERSRGRLPSKEHQERSTHTIGCVATKRYTQEVHPRGDRHLRPCRRGRPVRLLACSLARLLACSLVHLFTCSLVHLFALVHLFTCSLVHLFTCSLVHLFTCSRVHLFTCSLVHLFTCWDEINASRRMREAQQEKAEGDKILQVKAAEADAESKYLSGVGVARQRAAIIDGLRDSISDFSSQIQGTTPKDVMDLLLLTQYFDMLKDVGQHGAGKTLFLAHSPDSVAELQDKLHSGIMKSMIPESDKAASSMFR